MYASATVSVPFGSTYASSGVFSSFGPLPRTPGVPYRCVRACVRMFTETIVCASSSFETIAFPPGSTKPSSLKFR